MITNLSNYSDYHFQVYVQTKTSNHLSTNYRWLLVPSTASGTQWTGVSNGYASCFLSSLWSGYFFKNMFGNLFKFNPHGQVSVILPCWRLWVLDRQLQEQWSFFHWMVRSYFMQAIHKAFILYILWNEHGILIMPYRKKSTWERDALTGCGGESQKSVKDKQGLLQHAGGG